MREKVEEGGIIVRPSPPLGEMSTLLIYAFSTPSLSPLVRAFVRSVRRQPLYGGKRQLRQSRLPEISAKKVGLGMGARIWARHRNVAHIMSVSREK